jgi:carboxylesterase
MSEIIMPDRLRELAKPYFFKAEKDNVTNTLIILVHGFGASATETRPLGKYLCKQGYDIFGVLLTGHGTDSKELDSVKWLDWYESIAKVYLECSDKYQNVFIGGISLGGALSLYSATKLKFDGLFTINSLYRFSRRITPLIWLLHNFKIHRPRNVERIKWYVEHDLFAYQDDSTYAAYQIIRFLHVLHKRMNQIDIPTLIIQSEEDRTINPKSAEWIYESLKTEKELVQLPHGDHILTVDEHREEAFVKIGKFIAKQIKGK